MLILTLTHSDSNILEQPTLLAFSPGWAVAVTARKDDAPAADHAAITNVVGLVLFSGVVG